MTRLYGDEQREAVKKIKEEVINQLEELYLNNFEHLHEKGLGNGELAKLTQLLLLSRDAAIATLQSDSRNEKKN